MLKLIVPEFDTVPQFGLAYLTMRKSGCTSFKYAMRHLREPQESTAPQPGIHQHHDFLKLADRLPNPENWFKFTVVRDPIVRFLSFYGNKILDQNVVENRTVSDRFRFGYTPNMLLDDAIDVLLNQQFRCDPHVVPQSEVLDAVGYELNHVGRLESLEKTVQAVFEGTGCNIQMKHSNQRKIDYLKIDGDQFSRLASFYRSDQERFDYPRKFEEWLDTQTNENGISFCDEHGFEYVDEGKLIDYSIQKERHRFLVELKLRVSPSQSRTLNVQVISYNESVTARRNVYHRMAAPQDLLKEADQNGIVVRRFAIPFEKLPAAPPLEKLFVEIFFWSKELKGASINGYSGRKIPLAFPMQQ